MNIVADLHTHTLACGHAYSTLTEVIQEASDKGLKAVGLTEHGPGYPGSVKWAYFNTYRDIPRTFKDTKILCGAEVNIMDTSGTIDFTLDQLKKLDIVIVSCHKECIVPGADLNEMMNVWEKIMQIPTVDIIGHPDNPIYPVNADLLAQMAAYYNKAIEINNSSPLARPGSEDLCKQIIMAAKKHNTYIIIGSDAHYHKKIGQFDYAQDLISKYDIPEDLIINTSLFKIEEFLNSHR